ncbi:C4-dicarboxylate ABC transporter [Skermania sp. ID1734]|uniref:tellurite resistance/C4-dicarboxylate transporter family protein n=1 Tax=Skermania sp. ID1734 TaxID=2597516 RepID=UPI00117C9174|nr:tellurite resistance/C4-dicarboxylate transporter family protein [Skermania sp. ID1734]TSE00319.1 C4-dicarboxylate ABC transporter [Skermania sp. ID1734]
MRSLRLPIPDLPPDSFAVVMASGIVAIAARDQDWRTLDQVLTAIAVAAFAGLVVAGLLRVSRGRAPFSGSRRMPANDLRALTFVAACAVLGARWPHESAWVAAVLVVAGLAWIVLAVMLIRAVHRHSHTYLRHRARGAWLLATVATAGLCITASDLYSDTSVTFVLAIAGAAWLLALLAYIVVVSLILWRVWREGSIPALFTPDAWILMGGLAIATLAGDKFVFALESASAAATLTDVIKAVTVVTLVVATAWIPVLIVGEILYMRDHHWTTRIDTAWWSAVFPLGMYSVTTRNSARELDLPFLSTVSLVFLCVALAAWAIVGVTIVVSWLHRRLAWR